MLLGLSNLVAVANANADATQKKTLTLYSEMYDKLSKFTVYVIVGML